MKEKSIFPKIHFISPKLKSDLRFQITFSFSSTIDGGTILATNDVLWWET